MKDTYIRIRLSEEDKLALVNIAERDNTSMTGVITKWICDNKCNDKFGGSTGSMVNQNVRTKEEECNYNMGSGAKKNSGIRTSTGLWIDIK